MDSNDEGDNNVNSCNWAGVTNTDIDLYKLVLDTFLDNVYLPESVINCTDLFCKEHTPIILNYFNEIIDAIKIATEITIPKHKKHKTKGIVGWNKYVKFFNDKSTYRTNIWRSSQCPTEGVIFEIRKYVRKRYHKAIKFVKRNREKVVRENVFSFLQNKNSKIFWNEIRKLKSSKKISTNVMDDKIGIENITNVFKDKYRLLYNEFNSDQYDVLLTLNNIISDKCNDDN